MKKLLVILALILGLTSLQAGDMLKPDADGVYSGARSNPESVFYLNGIGGTWLAVGDPNMWHRCDRVMFRFPMMKYFSKSVNSLKSATLYFDYTVGGEIKRDLELGIEHFSAERVKFTGNDLLSNSVEEVATALTTPTDANNSRLSFDVTEAVRTDLTRGYEFCAFRVRSITTEEIGNADKKSSFITVEQGSMKLLLEFED